MTAAERQIVGDALPLLRRLDEPKGEGGDDGQRVQIPRPGVDGIKEQNGNGEREEIHDDNHDESPERIVRLFSESGVRKD